MSKNPPNCISLVSCWLLVDKIKYFACFTLIVFCAAAHSLAAPSDLDLTFNGTGKVISAPLASAPPGTGMALQSDGKIVMVGGVFSGGQNFVIVRYNPNGSLDTSFGTNGLVSLSFGGTYESANTVDIQSDGKIVVGGQTISNNSNSQVAVARLNSNGTLDTTFDGDGKKTILFTLFQISYPAVTKVIKVAGDGKIVVAGGLADSSNPGYFSLLGRLNSDGSLDAAFSGDGQENGQSGLWSDMIINNDGSIVLAGSHPTQFGNQMKVAKYNSDGTSAWNYSRGQQFQFMSLNGIAAQPDGKFVAVGELSARVIAIRLNANGTLDNTFTEATNTPSGLSRSVGIQADGKIVANVVFPNNTDGFSLLRYNTNGTVDTGFGNAGVVTTRVSGNGNETGRKLIIQPDGKILVGGSFGGTGSSDTGVNFVMVRYVGSSAVPGNTSFDYDGDRKADISVFRPADSIWYLQNSSNSTVSQPVFGTNGDIPTPADFDGDGKTDIAIFRLSTGTWWYVSSSNNTQNAVQWGTSGDIPRPSDFDGDGKADFVVYRPSSSVWYRLGSTGGSSATAFGIAEDKPLTGDFDGDGKSDLAVFRPSTGTWWYAASGSSNAFRAVQWGVATDLPVPSDFDGDGKTDIAVYRASTGVWYILNSSNGTAAIVTFGTAEDKPVSADYDGDGKSDIALWRPSTGVWYILRSTSGFIGLQWGASTDIPTPNAFNR